MKRISITGPKGSLTCISTLKEALAAYTLVWGGSLGDLSISISKPKS